MATGASNPVNFLILALLVFISACSSSATKQKKRQAEIYYGAGTQSLMSQDYTDALTNLMKANELDPDNSGILNNLGMAYYFKGEKDLAIKTLKKSLEIDSDNSDSKINLASIYFNAGDLNSAERIYKSVLKNLTYDKQARTYYNLGILELKRNNTSAAENYFKKSVKEDGNYCAGYFQLGMVQYGRRQYTNALKNFREASMGICYETPAAHYYQALTFTKLKRFNEARAKYDEIDARFKTSEFAVKSRANLVELNELERNFPSVDAQASRKMFESPEF